jgi:hypothetical protein
MTPSTGTTSWQLAALTSVLAFTAGCQTLQVERKTVAMADRLSEIQYGQVMDNLARLADNPGALPHYVLTDSGKTLIQATDQGSVGLTWNLFTVGTLFDSTLLGNVNPGLQYQQQDLTEWDGTPALEPIQELVMRGLFCRALGLAPSPAELGATESFFGREAPPFDDVNAQKALESVKAALVKNQLPPELVWSLANYKPAYLEALRQTYEGIRPGFVHVGHHPDVPKEACYVARHGHTYVWVTPQDMASLTDLTIAVLDVASTDTAAQTGKATKQPPANSRLPVTITPSAVP